MDPYFSLDLTSLSLRSFEDAIAEVNIGSLWTFEENKVFEEALAVLNPNAHDLFEKISLRIPGKTVQQIGEHYYALVEDVKSIESGRVELPHYTDTPTPNEASSSAPTPGAKPVRGRRRKGIPWTEEEHNQFLNGLKIYGKGDWKSISRKCVQTKNPTQVASHAQKHFIRISKRLKSEISSESRTS